uniref:Helicase n=1 Tax=viral metagenome TaxID=1070528 RepID=A0A6C0E5D4_9ZZZZ
MVKICDCESPYPSENETTYIEYFNQFPFELSNFQKYAIESIVEGHHVLVTAHTGSGKTLPAEFAIEYFVSKEKKVIYTSPIKALSNQKFYEFTKKFPHISFGILTGDIKSNPEADVLIMTTEILQNTLYKKNAMSMTGTSHISLPLTTTFDMDLNNELACVIFDEVHYINDPDRGKVWEETIMMLPRHVQMVMLSATLDKPEKFASWCENRGETHHQDQDHPQTHAHKQVYLTSTNHRVVPLTHYTFMTTTSAIFKLIKDKQLENEIKEHTNKIIPIQTASGVFNESLYHKNKKILTVFENKNLRMKRMHVLNQVTKYMVENNMLPALCFVLSRKQLEICAKEITTNLLEDDSKVSYTIKRECESIIRKLPNYEEYLNLPEYINIVYLLEKGIAIHHAGIMPVLREMIELLYSKGYIKLLFATETFAVGINMPTKSVIFTDVNKFDGNGMRMLYSHEYTQMAGRAGRRGIDTVGNVIHLTNLFKNVELTEYRCMMKGRPQSLISKFKISYNLLFNLIETGEQQFLNYIKRSMIQEDVVRVDKFLTDKLGELESEIEKLNTRLDTTQTPRCILEEQRNLLIAKPTSTNKKRKQIERDIQDNLDAFRNIQNDIKILEQFYDYKQYYNDTKTEIESNNQYLNNNINILLKLLTVDGFISETDLMQDPHQEPQYNLTEKGCIASGLREIHCLVFANFIERKLYEGLTGKQLCGIFSCFTNVSVNEDYRSYNVDSCDVSANNTIKYLKSEYEDYLKKEELYQINTGVEYMMHYDLIEYTMKWYECENAEECKSLLQTMLSEKEIFLGEFVKAILKINNISSEMERIAETTGAIGFLRELRNIPSNTLKFVVTNQSLYV